MLVTVIVLAVLLLAALGALVRSRLQADRLREERDRAREELARRPAPAVPSARQQRSVRAVKAVMDTAFESATRLREGGVSGLLMASIDDLGRWAAEDRTEIRRFSSVDGTVTVLFSDIEDSTSLNEQLGDDDWVALLGTHDKLVRACVDRYSGHIVKSQGDGFMIVFTTPADAVRAGIAIQDAIGSGGHRRLRRTPIRVRVGIHTGPVVEKGGDFFGTNVATAARVAAQAAGGEVLVSDEVRQALREVEDIVLVDFREAELKGLPGTYRLWEVAVL
ncbi:MAG: adenylate/guanylate cyclase domain-containing protein [Marmoricola sp.]